MRKVVIGAASRSVTSMLQWSRNFRVAESALSGGLVAGMGRLQWSRNFRVAESEWGDNDDIRKGALQWSRNFRVAER